MTTEWLRIMLEEIARKEQEARESRAEESRRQTEQRSPPPSGERASREPGSQRQ